jgi:sensor histidine kinase YesM
MTELSIPSQDSFQATPPMWPMSLIVPITLTLLLLAFFTTLELPIYVHGAGTPRGTAWVVLISYAIAVCTWMWVETKATWYARAPIDQPQAWFRRHLKRLPIFIVCFIVVGYGIRMIGFTVVGFRYRFNFQSILGLMFFYESIKAALLYCCWLGLAFGVLSFARMRQQTEHLLATQKTLVEAKLAQLKGQLRPHFLFNALNTISSLMQVDVPRADRMLTQLGDLLRANLNASERNTVPLNEELQLLRLYAAIMQERFTGRITVEWNIDANATAAWVPTMLLQPLLENAFKHGVERNSGSDRIVVSAQRTDDTLRISIRNSNSALGETYTEGLGLGNCRERLRLLYSDTATLALTNGAGVTASVTMPWTGNG